MTADLQQLSRTFRVPAIDFEAMREGAPEFGLISFPDALRRKCVAIRSATDDLLVVLSDPRDVATQDWLDGHLKQSFSLRLARPEDLTAYLAQQERGLRAMDSIDAGNDAARPGRDKAQEISIAAISEHESATVKLVNSTLYDALKAGASDIHLETGARSLAVKYRIDGVLATIKEVQGADLAEQAISRVKVLSELDIAERRVPQDGRFKARFGEREIDFRVSIMPSVFGEDAVLRVLDKRSLMEEQGALRLEQLGFEPSIIASLRELSEEPHGMLLVTGPTGSGKTTTLYTLISEIHNGQEKIVTIEDPVEYQLPGILQIPVNEKKGLTFARGLRSILRHDPDRIMVGEIRDPETAEIAVQSALTGHLVFTTVHANNVFDVVGRFMHMGVDPYNVASALNAVMAQRLVRLRCRSCAGKGCGECRGIGYRGRKAVAELMILNDELREMIATRAPLTRLKERARASGTGSLREAALRLVEQGETTMEEVKRGISVAG